MDNNLIKDYKNSVNSLSVLCDYILNQLEDIKIIEYPMDINILSSIIKLNHLDTKIAIGNSFCLIKPNNILIETEDGKTIFKKL